LRIGQDDGEMDEAGHAGNMTYTIRFFRRSGNLLDSVAFHHNLD
jgi:hypothetical protein